MTVPELIALALAGFSIVAVPLLLAAQFTVYRDVELGRWAAASGAVLLCALAGLQALHMQQLLHPDAAFPGTAYRMLLFAASPASYLFFRGALQPREADRPTGLLLYAPIAAAPWIPSAVAIPLAFAFGTVYAALLTRLALRLREQRRRYRLEAITFAAHGAIAATMLLLGLAAPWIGLHTYMLGYAALIGIGLSTALYTLLRIPDLAVNAAEAVRTAYANTTLRNVDVDAAMARLEQLMTAERLYTHEALSLASLAEAMDLGPHQLSELINSRFGIGFPRYVREHRVRAAQRMLLDEPRASVLSVGLAVGFTSQSNFYAAFREITGDVPGRYRRRGMESPAE